jgi:hypothetical protein
MAFKTYTVNIGAFAMTDFDDAIAKTYNYDLFQLPGETKSQFGRRMQLRRIQQDLQDGLVIPAVDTARTNTINNTPILI